MVLMRARKKAILLLLAVASCLLPSPMTASASAPADPFERAQLRLVCALASMSAYQGEMNTLVRGMLATSGWTMERHSDSSAVAETKYDLLDISLADGEKLYVLAVTGTESVKDAEVDLRIHRVPFGVQANEPPKGSKPSKAEQDAAEQAADAAGIPLVHEGFNGYLQAALFSQKLPEQGDRTIGECIAEELAAHPDETLYLTGHSLGGAVATLAAARLADLGVRPEQLEVITFGAPTVGNEAFAAAYGPRMHLERITMRNDPVKAALQSISRYAHFGDNVEYQPLKGSARFPHDMVLYLDGAIRGYYDEAWKAGKTRLEARYLPIKQGVAAKVYVAPVAFDLEHRLKPAQPYMQALMKDRLMEDIQFLTFAEEGTDISLPALCKEARQQGCDYVLLERFEGKRARFAEDVLSYTLEEEIFDTWGNLAGAYSATTSTTELTPLEITSYLQHEGSDERRAALAGSAR